MTTAKDASPKRKPKDVSADMGLREGIAKRPALIAVSAGICVIVLAVSSVLTYKRGGRPNLPKIPGECFYTIDDGATLFTDSLWKDPPFDREGHEAVRAYVFTCDHGARHWVQYLEKWSLKDKTQRALGNAGPPGALVMPNEQGVLVKKPGAGAWIPRKNPDSVAITTPKCPDGTSSGTPASVQP